MQDLVTEYCWGAVWSRPGLDRRTRSLVNLGMLTALNRRHELGVHIRVNDDRIEEIRFHGHGCAISQASASIASEELKGMTLQEVGELDADWMIDLLGIPVSATRRKCALLNLKVVRGAVTGDHDWPT